MNTGQAYKMQKTIKVKKHKIEYAICQFGKDNNNNNTSYIAHLSITMISALSALMISRAYISTHVIN